MNEQACTKCSKRVSAADMSSDGYRCKPCAASEQMRWARDNPEKVSATSRRTYVKRCGGMRMACCRNCQSLFECTARAFPTRKFCSKSCKDGFNNRVKSWVSYVRKPERSCLHCGDGMGRSYRSDAAYCSESCNSAAHQATRKANMKVRVGGRVERVSRAYIVERDGGRCHLCGKKPARGQLHIDHVIPLSRGGEHVLENLRVACAKCNLSKRADARGEQLMLVG